MFVWGVVYNRIPSVYHSIILALVVNAVVIVMNFNLLSDSQAELRALEEGDGSAGGSSPCSETSQEASGSRGPLLKKNRWKTAFPSAASPDSNSRSSDLQDNIDTSESKELHTHCWRVVNVGGVGGNMFKNPIPL